MRNTNKSPKIPIPQWRGKGNGSDLESTSRTRSTAKINHF